MWGALGHIMMLTPHRARRLQVTKEFEKRYQGEGDTPGLNALETLIPSLPMLKALKVPTRLPKRSPKHPAQTPKPSAARHASGRKPPDLMRTSPTRRLSRSPDV